MLRMQSLWVLLACCAMQLASAEPYLAVQSGFKCVQCHVNATGGGLRNAFGNAYSQTQLPADPVVDPDNTASTWLGKIGDVLALGADLRASATVTHIPNQDDTRVFELRQARLYVDVAIVHDRLDVYVDQLLAPGAAVNREAYLRYTTRNQQWYLKAGQMYLPFGLRLQDDTAFVRQVAGINMTTPDAGIEVGWESGAWSTQLALTNGSAGGAEANTGKQVSLQTSVSQNRWRIGLGANLNDAERADRRAVAVFAGVRTGSIAWLAEADYVVDQSPTGPDRKRIVGLIEANWLVAQGHNVKLTAEMQDPNREVTHDNQARLSGLYEYSPIQFLQLRGGVRYHDGIPQNDLQNRRVYFLELHGFY